MESRLRVLDEPNVPLMFGSKSEHQWVVLAWSKPGTRPKVRWNAFLFFKFIVRCCGIYESEPCL